MARRLNGEGTIRQRKDGLYEVRITSKPDPATGKKQRISRYAKTREQALKIRSELQLQYGGNAAVPTSMTLGEWLPHWLELYARPSVRHSTYVSYEGYVRKHLVPALGAVPLNKLVPADLQRFYLCKLQEDHLAPKTISNLHACLHRALQQAMKEQMIPSNPCDAVDLPRKETAEISVLTREQQAKLMQESYRHRYGVFIRLALSTGMRIGEIVGLRWDDIDFTNRILFVRSTLNRLPTVDGESKTQLFVGSPKTKNGRRSIPLFDAIISDLADWRKTQETDAQLTQSAYENTGYVVTNEFGKPIEPRTFRDHYIRILKAAGLPHFTFHALRHTFATRAIEQGMDVKALSKILGHASVGFTLDTYAHLLDDHKRESMMLMQELYPQPATQKPGGKLIYLPFTARNVAKE